MYTYTVNWEINKYMYMIIMCMLLSQSQDLAIWSKALPLTTSCLAPL